MFIAITSLLFIIFEIIHSNSYRQRLLGWISGDRKFFSSISLTLNGKLFVYDINRLKGMRAPMIRGDSLVGNVWLWLLILWNGILGHGSRARQDDHTRNSPELTRLSPFWRYCLFPSFAPISLLLFISSPARLLALYLKPSLTISLNPSTVHNLPLPISLFGPFLSFVRLLSIPSESQSLATTINKHFYTCTHIFFKFSKLTLVHRIASAASHIVHVPNFIDCRNDDSDSD